MKIIYDKQELAEIINTIQKAVTAKNTMPILECIKIEAFNDGNIIFTANNLDLCIEYRSQCNVVEEGSIAISSKMFGEIIRRFPSGDVLITVNENNNIMTLKCAKSEFKIQGLEAKDYPSVPDVDENYKFSISQEVLKRMIRKTIFAVSQNESRRPILTGELFDINTGVLTLVSTDAYRVAKIEAVVDSSLQNTKFVIPGITLRELLKVLEGGEGNIDIIVAKRHVQFCFENFRIVSRLLEGEYINYKPIFQTPNSIVVNVGTREFEEILERAALIINEDLTAKKEKVPVKLDITNEAMELNCSTGKGHINDTIDVNKIGDDIEIGFNHRYLLEALRCCEDERIKMELTNSRGACFIRPEKESDYIYMILPVRLYEE